MSEATRFSAEVRELAVRLVRHYRAGYPLAVGCVRHHREFVAFTAKTSRR